MDAPGLVHHPTGRPAPARLLAAVAGTAIVLAWPLMGTAHAAVEGPCGGSVTIDGSTYTPDNDSRANPIVVPDRPGLTAAWEGNTDFPITDHAGHIGVRVGGALIEVAQWSGANADEQTQAAGTYSVDDARDLVPAGLVGIYEVAGEHVGAEGSCKGSVMVQIAGNPLTTVPGATAAVGAAATVAGLGLAARGRGGPIPTDIGAMQ